MTNKSLPDFIKKNLKLVLQWSEVGCNVSPNLSPLVTFTEQNHRQTNKHATLLIRMNKMETDCHTPGSTTEGRRLLWVLRYYIYYITTEIVKSQPDLKVESLKGWGLVTKILEARLVFNSLHYSWAWLYWTQGLVYRFIFNGRFTYTFNTKITSSTWLSSAMVSSLLLFCSGSGSSCMSFMFLIIWFLLNNQFVAVSLKRRLPLLYLLQYLNLVLCLSFCQNGRLMWLAVKLETWCHWMLVHLTFWTIGFTQRIIEKADLLNE